MDDVFSYVSLENFSPNFTINQIKDNFVLFSYLPASCYQASKIRNNILYEITKSPANDVSFQLLITCFDVEQHNKWFRVQTGLQYSLALWSWIARWKLH